MDIKTPLNSREAGQVKTVFEDKNIQLKYRELLNFSPETIARRLKLDAKEVARAAGRSESRDG